jgi:hypothetical protein
MLACRCSLHHHAGQAATQQPRPDLPKPYNLLPAGLSAGAFDQNIRRAYAAAIDQAAGTSLGSSSVTTVAAPTAASGRRLLAYASYNACLNHFCARPPRRSSAAQLICMHDACAALTAGAMSGGASCLPRIQQHFKHPVHCAGARCCRAPR